MIEKSLDAYYGLHKDQDVFILGCGPSLHYFDFSLIKNRPVIAINESVMKYKNPSYVLTCDIGLLVCSSWQKYIRHATYPVITLDSNVNHLRIHGGLAENREVCFAAYRTTLEFDPENKYLSVECTSVFSAVHFAKLCGAKRIIVVGCDCQMDKLGNDHYWDFPGEEKHYSALCPENLVKFPNIYYNIWYEYWKKVKKLNPSVYVEAWGGRLEEIFPKYKGD